MPMADFVFYKQLINNLDSSILVLDQDLTVRYLNPAAEALLQVSGRRCAGEPVDLFFHDEKQKDVAEKSKQTLDSSGVFNNPIITQIVPAPIFYAAEEYHQKYFKKHGLS